MSTGNGRVKRQTSSLSLALLNPPLASKRQAQDTVINVMLRDAYVMGALAVSILNRNFGAEEGFLEVAISKPRPEE